MNYAFLRAHFIVNFYSFTNSLIYFPHFFLSLLVFYAEIHLHHRPSTGSYQPTTTVLQDRDRWCTNLARYPKQLNNNMVKNKNKKIINHFPLTTKNRQMCNQDSNKSILKCTDDGVTVGITEFLKSPAERRVRLSHVISAAVLRLHASLDVTIGTMRVKSSENGLRL